ncbi:hypothetical protein Q8A67_008640 [Cirrhinus molitorella]|uniref:GYF domain-containing protein n=1 Tax=Cirrhinus molitorella TaxID=172907 RepID=A0AA88PYP8_9TELE|nr:hypothetical protein Q8A67_008640 [Cirrhinus molitorella]
MIPVDLHDKEFLPILQEEPLPPLALVPFTEEEQRNFSMSVNSAAVLRLTGRGGGTVAGAPRGRSSSRGRGRGRGDGGFYQRSFDEVEGGFGRGGREMHRSQSWEERGDRRFEKPGRKDPDGAPAHFPVNHIRANYEDTGAGNARKHEFIRSESDNWRTTRDEQNGEEDDGGWRLAGSRRDERWCPPSPDGPRSAGWREHPDQRRRFPFDSRGEDGGYRRPRSGSGSVEEERDSLPEWCLEDAEEETGTFDSSGAFLSLKVRALEKAPKEPILEEAELDFRPLEENEECTEKDDSEPEQTKDTDTESRCESDRNEEGSKSEEPSPVAVPFPAVVTPPKVATPAPLPSVHPEQPVESERTTVPELRSELSKAPLHTTLPNSIVEAISIPHVTNTLPDLPVPTPSVLPVQSVPTQPQPVKPLEMPVVVAPVLPHSTGIVGPISRPSALPSDMDEDEGLKHFEQEAEKMVAYLQDGGVDDERLATKIGHKPTALPMTHEAAFKWFYKDPQGEIQGPFNNQEMSEWFQAGYFTMTLQVKRGCDEMFQPLGEMIKLWGRVPFTPGPTLPPIQGDADQERLKRQQELNALNMYQLQQIQYQYLIRQQYALAQQKVLSSAPPPQQQQLNLLLHQALKIRTPEPQQSLLPPVTRSMSVPDSGSVWEMQNPSTQASCSPNLQPTTPSTWEGSSVWDLPLDSMPQASSIEQMQLEKAKALKLEMEKREAELRAKREEEERKRLEEALRARQEEERKRLEEEELARRKQEEALQRQREQEEAQRRKKEEEERLAQEEALRRLEERRREEEERRQREEFLRKQQEEERRKQEELEAQRRREEEKRLEEEAAAAAAALAKQQQEEQKRREQEAQRQQELQRQRQQQQEALRRLQQQQQQQQLAQMKLPSSSKWGQQSTTANTLSQSQNALSLAEIQKLEEERERQTREEQRRQQQELQRVQQQQQPQTKLSGWGSVAKQPAATKSLLEIQREEAQQMKQRKEQQQQQQQQQQQPPQQQQQQQQHSTVTQQNRTQNRVALNTSVWGSVNNVGLNWMMDSSVWGDAQNSNIGFWDEAVKEAAPPQATRKSHNQKNKGNANLSNSSSGKASKKVEEEEKLLKLFQGANKNQDGFMQWCEQTLHTLNTANNLDVPTFASFLKEVDSPYEVHDYVRAYLGDTPQAKDFAKQFLERRAKQNANQQKPQQGQQQKQQDSVWGMSQMSQSVLLQQQQQQQRFETVTSGKKKKKQKMVRADPSLLGFSVNASSERLNMGEIETVEDF